LPTSFKDGFTVDLVEDVTHADMIRALDRLKENMRPGFVVFLYFGGYGMQVGGLNYHFLSMRRYGAKATSAGRG
jgi:hypothetical protein